jgi:hypothetical protein
MRDVGKVVDDELRDEPSQCETHNVGKVVDDEPRDEPRQPDARRMRCSRR